MEVPTEADWRSEPWDLEIPYAYDHFFDKTYAEAFELFEENAIYYQEDLQYMPVNCFRFYVHAYMDYLLSENSKGDSDGASCFYGIVSIRKNELQNEETLLEKTRNVLERLKDHQQWYDASVETYGDFAEKTRRGLKLLRKP